MNLPRIQALDLRPAKVVSGEPEWDWPVFPRRLWFFIKTGKFPYIEMSFVDMLLGNGVQGGSYTWSFTTANFNKNVVMTFSPEMEDWSVMWRYGGTRRRLPWWWIAYVVFILGIFIADMVMVGWL